MKVKCIENIGWGNLTIGEIYDATDNRYDDKYYDILLIYNHGWSGRFPKELFKPLSEIRNETIDKLLSDDVTNVK